MCNPVAIGVVAIGLTIGSGYMAYKAGKKAERKVEDEKRQRIEYATEKAIEIKEVAGKRAAKIRAEAIVFRATQLAQQSASGALIGDGSTDSAISATMDLAEQDALIAIYDGNQAAKNIVKQAAIDGVAMDAKGEMYRDQGRASLLSSFARASYQGYQISNN